jgi:hypothetical protein
MASNWQKRNRNLLLALFAAKIFGKETVIGPFCGGFDAVLFEIQIYFQHEADPFLLLLTAYCTAPARLFL